MAKATTKTTTKTKKSAEAKEHKLEAKAPSDKKPKKVSAQGTRKRFGAESGKQCKIKSCKREYRAKGYCKAHYRKWRQGEYGKARYTACTDMSCFKPAGENRHGFCEDHYQNYYVKGLAQAKTAAPEKPAAAPKPAEKPAAAAG